MSLSTTYTLAWVLITLCDYTHGTLSLSYPTEFHLKAEDINLMTGLVQPVEMWYSTDLKRYRNDYFGGSTKELYIRHGTKSYGIVYTTHPATTKDLESEIICEKIKIRGDMDSMLPELKHAQPHGETEYNGRKVQIWYSGDSVAGVAGGRVEETLLTYRTSDGQDVPISYERKISESWTGRVTKHSIKNFYGFNSTVSLEEFRINNETVCEDVVKLGKNLKNHLNTLQPGIPAHINFAFTSYVKHHKKAYTKNEHVFRKDIFLDNWRHIKEHNMKNLSYKMEINKFSDRTNEELQYLTGTKAPRAKLEATHTFPYSSEQVDSLAEQLPKELDLRLEGLLTPIKSQGNCGSCWSFSTTAAVEGAIAKALGGTRFDLSEQSLVDCAWGYGNMGCDGGLLDAALKYVVEYGIPTTEEYGAYIEQVGYCQLLNVSTVHKISGFSQVPIRSANSLRVALHQYGPVAVAIHANMNMKEYSNGIYYDPQCAGMEANHGVTVVGYGVRDGQQYWIVRNSWGDDWGEGGYILMAAADDNCSILDYPYYVII
ncbi:cathepsin L-like proteinase [Achroia grisella]|uniref:cathepsin L-like proteinase n=1 Tax=Achroia grisella TaxID=688607 RepID=UPI0027D2369E|nr:cathepsin L-like proteinase [Achroia grisella]